MGYWADKIVQISLDKLCDTPVTLNDFQRKIVDDVLIAHSQIRMWHIHAKNVRTNHVHIVVTANRDPDTVAEQYKAWASRKLNINLGRKRSWWTEGQSTMWIYDEEYLENVIRYVLEGQ